jgi:hypothetical protein
MLLCALYAVHKYRQIVLEAPLRFEKGNAVAKGFTVDLASNYWLAIDGIKYPSSYRFSLTDPTPADQFSARFQITCDGRIVASGDNGSNPRHPASLRRDEFTRFIADFPAEPNRIHDLSLRIEDVAPELMSRPAKAAIYLDFHVREGANYLAALLRLAGIGIVILGLLFALPLWYSLAQRLLRGRPTT